jgi:hypothetical protein
MSVSGVCGGADWATARQATGDARAAGARGCGDGDCGGPQTHGGHHGHRSHHGRHGGFVQAIRQVLDQLLAQAAGAAADTTATGTVTTDAVTAATPATEPAATGAASTDATPTDDVPSRWQVRHALHAFMHTLFQTLAGSATAMGSATGAIDADGDGDGTTPAEAATGPDAPGPAARRFAYGTPNMSLSTLASDAAPDGASGADLSALQASFQNLLDALGATDSGITLQSFLHALLDHQGGGSAPTTDPTATGTLVEVSA